MTTLFSEEVTCFVCGKSSEHTVLGSTSTFGWPDLDLRQAPPSRHSIQWWVQRCPTCGYCAPTISEGPGTATQTVTAPAYIARLNDPAFLPLAKAFLCWSVIQATAGNHADAGWAALNAAWVCDDGNAATQAETCRREASAREELLCLTDLWRAAGSPENRDPNTWSRKDGQDFIDFINENAPNTPVGRIYQTEKGRYGASWACEQLFMAFAKYLSHEFHAHVNDVSGGPPAVPGPDGDERRV